MNNDLMQITIDEFIDCFNLHDIWGYHNLSTLSESDKKLYLSTEQILLKENDLSEEELDFIVQCRKNNFTKLMFEYAYMQIGLIMEGVDFKRGKQKYDNK